MIKPPPHGNKYSNMLRYILILLTASSPSCIDAFSLERNTAQTRGLSPTQLHAISILPQRRARVAAVITATDFVVANQQQQIIQQRGWHRKVMKRVFRRKGRDATAAAVAHPLQSTALLLDKAAATAQRPLYFDYQEGILKQSVWNQALTPPMQQHQNHHSSTTTADSTISTSTVMIPPLLVIDPQAESVAALEPHPTPLVLKQPPNTGTFLHRTTKRYAESIVTSLINRWCQGNAENMVVTCDPKSGLFDLARGHFRCDAVVNVDQIQFPCLQFSGGQLSTQRLAVNLYSFTAVNRGYRFPNQFDFTATDVLFTADDLFASDCIRNGLARLLTRILRNRGMMKASRVRIESVKILKDGSHKISFKGHVKTGITATADVPFEVRTGLATASRGHVLTFPGLELSLSPALGLFFPVPDISLDLGHSAQIRDLNVDCNRGVVVSCTASITPSHTLQLLQSYAQRTKSYAAPFSVDVGRFLTRIGNFSA